MSNEEAREALQNFLDTKGRLKAFPAKRKMKIYALIYLSDKIETDREYTEREINKLLLEWHTFDDPATLRRELYNYQFLDRSIDGSIYRLTERQPTPDELGF